MQKKNLRKRDLYLKQMIAFQDTEMIKVMTGIRRCGKSSLMKLMAEHLRESGVTEDQILEMNFESMSIPEMDARGFYEYVKSHICPDKRTYLFFDEVQKVSGWENAVNSFRVDFDCDIYITGSNAYLLSSELSTYLSGRYVEIKVLLKAALTDDVNSREVFMKGIDASYHYEGYNVYKTEDLSNANDQSPRL